ncbi:hypothetical protein GIB67_031408 [Kingdonia uniflora]|uniref:Uncharacterized protein n=1 Tax=Kingdonia uniflora TaxID=39325 RepID=A0A7J7MB19_9MAGN|nr:hypothetical protein GIB67_031408 [Kingdonia uniflora]
MNLVQTQWFTGLRIPSTTIVLRVPLLHISIPITFLGTSITVSSRNWILTQSNSMRFGLDSPRDSSFFQLPLKLVQTFLILLGSWVN